MGYGWMLHKYQTSLQHEIDMFYYASVFGSVDLKKIPNIICTFNKIYEFFNVVNVELHLEIKEFLLMYVDELYN